MKTSQSPLALPRHLRGALACGVLGAVLATASPSFAEGAADEALASTLFKEGRALMEAGDYARACPKFVEAQRLHAATGTALNVGDCFEKTGKLATAWGAFKAAEVLARKNGDAARQAEAARRAESLSPRLPKLAIVVPPAARVAGFELKRDGAVVGEGQWGSSLPVDVGAHTIETSAPGRKAWSTVVRIETDGSTASVEVPVMDAIAASSGDAKPAPFWGAQRIAGVSLGGAGFLGMIVGAVFAAKAAGKNSDSLPHCLPSDEVKCDATGVALRNEAFDAAQISNVTFIAGGILAASGIVVFLTAPSAAPRKDTAPQARVQPMVGAGFAGLSLQRAW